MEIQIIAGFSGAGKTTFINQYMPMLSGKTIVIQNESGEVKLDAKTDKEVPVEKINEGCICCTLALAFQQSIVEIESKYQPDRILIEPSSVGYLKDVVKACVRAKENCQGEVTVTKLITLVDMSCLEECLDGLGMVFQEQIQSANLLLVSHMDEVAEEEKAQLFDLLRELNPWAVICEKDFKELTQEELQHLLDETEDSGEEADLLFYTDSQKKTKSNVKKIIY